MSWPSRLSRRALGRQSRCRSSAVPSVNERCLWVKQPATLGHVERYVQLIPAVAMPINQVVLKPAVSEPLKEKPTSLADNSAASPTKWRPTRAVPVAARAGNKPAAPAATEKSDDGQSNATEPGDKN